jgi:broad specificity phosphatase PhoE
VRLVIVRHGQTNHNRDSIALGRDDVPLNETGLRQAEALAARLSTETIAAVYASPLQRAKDTAAAIAARHGLGVAIEEDFVEMEVGELDGLPYPEILERFPGVIERWLSESGPEHPFPGGESLAQVSERAWAAALRLESRHAGETVVAVTHNFVILCILARTLGLDLAKFRRLKHEVAAMSVVDISGERATVLTINDRCHLATLDNLRPQ